ncbi:serine hydrolase [Flagellimonas sp. HMM57]|uniref:serine hydrolase n=1 Tax=unclassified Flagellimonas TaxID=2644544 RepID=UPI0013D01EE1|nr:MULTISPECIES: serine hydrolase [unclassified Flagellimonas]UII75875.1 serine hydrolase [Flagellimonas sp. HMM57]
MKTCLIQTFVCISILVTSCYSQEKLTKAYIDTILNTHGRSLLKDTNAFAASISVIKNGQTYTKHYGEIDKGKGNKITDTTLFEIASVTKVFTGTLMAKAVLGKKVNLEDDVRKFLPGKYPNLEFQGRPIRVKDLLGFKSGVNRSFPDISSLRRVEDDSTAFRLKEFGTAYDKSDFFEDLRKVELDTFPGTTNYYNELCPELTGYILEKVYQKDFRKIVEDELFEKLGLNATSFRVPSAKKLLNGYNINGKLMPNFAYRIWGAGGMLKSTISDLNKFLKYHLRLDDKVVLESRRNIVNSNENWNGYLWDDINVTRNGLRCLKHGGGYGVQNIFVVFPEQNLGISLVINQSTPMTHERLQIAINSIADDIGDLDKYRGETYGYRIENDTVIFQYIHPEKLNVGMIKSVSVAGTFNNWNPNNDSYQLDDLGQGVYELSVPISNFQKANKHEFRFVINRNSWLTIPKEISNRTHKRRYNNIMLVVKK